MKESSGQSGKRILPLTMGLVLFFGCLLFLAPFMRGSFFDGQEVTGREGTPFSGFDPGKGNTGRYKIMDRCYREMAVSFMMNSLYARPLEIEDLSGTAAYLAANLGLDEKELIRDLKAERGFVWLARRLPESSSAEILKKALKGVYVVKEAQRYYPGGTSGAHVVGFIEEGNGLAGVESFYDTMLGGGFGLVKSGEERPQGHLILTIDLQIQKVLEDNLAALQLETGAVSASGLLINAKDGSVLAMVSMPDFDSNRYWESTREERLNRTINQKVKADSLEQILSFAAEYDRLTSGEQDPLGAVKGDLQFDIASGRTPRQWFSEVDGRYLSPELLAWPAEMQAGEGSLSEFASRLGIYGWSGIDLPAEERRVVGGEDKTTPLQMLAALSSLVNGGTKVSPHLGRAVLDPQKGTLKAIEHPGGGAVVRPETAKKVVDILAAASLSKGGIIVAESMEMTGPEIEETGQVDESAGDDYDEDRPASYRTMLVSFTPGKESGLAMYLSLEEAAVATGEKTPMRIAGERLMERVQEMAGHELGKPGLQSMALREAQIYDDWLKSRQVGKIPVTAARVAERQTAMPDLKGLSIRRALRILQPFGLKVKVVGSGRIVAQLPQPGLKIGKGECVLTLQSDN